MLKVAQVFWIRFSNREVCSLEEKAFGILLTIIMLIAVSPMPFRAAAYDFSAYPEMGVLVCEVGSGDAIISNNASSTYYPAALQN
jgi:hypothetical protein